MAGIQNYILVTLSGQVANELDEDKRERIKKAFAPLSTYKGDLPQYLVQHRMNLSGTAFIIEALWDKSPTKAEVVKQIATELGLQEALVNGNLTFRVFAGDWEQSRQAVLDYINTNRADWERPMPADSMREA